MLNHSSSRTHHAQAIDVDALVEQHNQKEQHRQRELEQLQHNVQTQPVCAPAHSTPFPQQPQKQFMAPYQQFPSSSSNGLLMVGGALQPGLGGGMQQHAGQNRLPHQLQYAHHQQPSSR